MTHRLYGSIDRLTDCEQRPLRPIGMSVQEVAARTRDLLARLGEAPGVRVIAGLRLSTGVPPIAFAVSAGHRVVLVEPVAWPAGAYSTTPQGGVLCDGTYIGQSVHPLLGAVRHLRRRLHKREVAAIVVVHPSGAGTPALPPTAPAGLSWLPPEEVCRHLVGRLRSRVSVRRKLSIGRMAVEGKRKDATTA
ncbi:hypothetical protein ACIA5D_08910 [Actinoplanes sp. NPDC051513]|uniref:hypothetical protein n=1 Tax=Actinoplanes sp. NPDC051513 TaxID=3363908 RepID=UPI003791277C